MGEEEGGGEREREKERERERERRERSERDRETPVMARSEAKNPIERYDTHIYRQNGSRWLYIPRSRP